MALRTNYACKSHHPSPVRQRLAVSVSMNFLVSFASFASLNENNFSLGNIQQTVLVARWRNGRNLRYQLITWYRLPVNALSKFLSIENRSRVFQTSKQTSSSFGHSMGRRRSKLTSPDDIWT